MNHYQLYFYCISHGVFHSPLKTLLFAKSFHPQPSVPYSGSSATFDHSVFGSHWLWYCWWVRQIKRTPGFEAHHKIVIVTYLMNATTTCTQMCRCITTKRELNNSKTIVSMQSLHFSAQTVNNVTVAQTQNTWLPTWRWHQLTHNVPAFKKHAADIS